MTKSMTKGNPFRLILEFSIPLLLGNLFQQTYNMADAAIVGQILGPNALAAVGATSSVQFLVLGFCIGSMVGFAIPIAQEFGANRLSRMRQYEYQGIFWTTIFSVVVTGLTILLCHPILHTLQVPSEIYQDTYQYINMIFIGIPFTLLYNFLSSLLRAVGDSKTPFYFLTLSAILNIFLDIFCIVILKMGVFGAAFATVVSQAISGILCFLLIRKKLTILHMSEQERRFHRSMSKKVLGMGVPMGLQYSITAIGSMVLQAANNGLGTLYVSGFTAGLKIKQFMLSPFDAFGTAVSTYVSQNYGAKEEHRIHEGIRKGVQLALSYSILSGIIMIFFGRKLSLLFVNANRYAVLEASALYLRRMGYGWWLLGFLNVIRMSIQGLGYANRAIFCGIIEMIGRVVVSVAFVKDFGYHAITWADQVAWLGADLFLFPALIITLKQIHHLLENERIAIALEK
ncbi:MULTISPECIES: MATE family efflux transporter [Terrabacteria group]|uniref:MATE family efflux transporter n=1 Tax=Bacillati TaxID=1783272 RepID=UPI001939F30B|nr:MULTISPECIES: MATE family efflux transporter [Terrabacteria group]MBW9212373.1 MATE family efflux transporter [Trueperella sp. zg.1013]QRG86094.1 MATE family efflux transporter [Bulleidia sp. zg-1006]